jgi:hypothetical protein
MRQIAGTIILEYVPLIPAQAGIQGNKCWS